MPAIMQSGFNPILLIDTRTLWMTQQENALTFPGSYFYPKEEMVWINIDDIQQIYTPTKTFHGQEVQNYLKIFHDQLQTEHTTVTYYAETLLNWFHRNNILVLKPSDVRDYLIEYHDIADLLPHICKVAQNKFQNRAQLSLELYKDPEIADEYLTLYVRQKRYDDNILNQIEEVCAEYEEALVNKSGWLIVTTDFQPPRAGNGF